MLYHFKRNLSIFSHKIVDYFSIITYSDVISIYHSIGNKGISQLILSDIKNDTENSEENLYDLIVPHYRSIFFNKDKVINECQY